ITRATGVGCHFACYDNHAVPGRNVNIERLIRIGAGATVSDPVAADVFRIEGIQVSSREHEVGSRAGSIRIDGRAQGRGAVVQVGVGIVMVPLQIAKDRTGRGGRAVLWNATAEESIVLCGIAKGDASGKRTWRARRPRRPGSRWSRGGRPAAQPCYSQRVAGVRAPCVMDLAYHHNKGL